MRGRGLSYPAGLRSSRPALRCVPWPPDTATAEDIRRFQLHQHESGIGPATINGAVSALRFLFLVTLKRQDLGRVLVIMRYQRKLPGVLNVEEVTRLLEIAPGIHVQRLPPT